MLPDELSCRLNCSPGALLIAIRRPVKISGKTCNTFVSGSILEFDLDISDKVVLIGLQDFVYSYLFVVDFEDNVLKLDTDWYATYYKNFTLSDASGCQAAL